jgi:formyltetrahydrofolate-dependent phosphoribosylglycinamide formyltransferase
MSHLRIAFFVSGNGTLFETIATRCREGSLNAEPVLVISSSSKAAALERARRLDVPATVMRRETFASEDDYARAILDTLAKQHVNFVCLAGFLKLIPGSVVAAYQNRMLNIHPALLPAFGGHGMYGHRVHEAVIEYGARISGATVHLVDDQYDHGPVVLQRAVFVRPDDTADTLAERVHAIEHDLYVDAVRLFADDRVEIAGRHINLLSGKRE